MSKKLVSIIFAVGCFCSLYSQTRITEREACLSALTRVFDEYPDSNIQILNVETMSNKNGVAIIYEVETSVGTNVLLSANKACIPILCTHPSGDNRK